MRIEIVRAVEIQHAGRPLRLDIGDELDFAEVVARSLIAGGSAREVAAIEAAPENKAKRGRKAA